WAERCVLGLPPPAWQRPSVWSRQQQERFIHSVWMGIDLGTYLYNDPGPLECYEQVNGVLVARPNTDALLDGQQRLGAIQAFWRDEISIEDADGVPRVW